MHLVKSMTSNRLFIAISTLAVLCLLSAPSIETIVVLAFVSPLLWLAAKSNKYGITALSGIARYFPIIFAIAILLSSFKRFITVWTPSNKIALLSNSLGISAHVFLTIAAIIGCIVGFWCIFKVSVWFTVFLKSFCTSIISSIKQQCKTKAYITTLLKSVLVAIVCIAISATMATALLCGAFALPTDSVERNVKISAENIIKEGTYPSVFSWCHSLLDNYTDSIMLLEAANQNNENLISKAMLCFQGTISGNDPYETLIDHYCKDIAFNGSCTYGRYWHGYQVMLRPLLSIMDYSAIRTLNLCVQIGLTGFIIILLWRNNLKNVIIPYCIIYLMLMPIVIGKSLQFSSCFYTMSIGIIGAILVRNSKKKNSVVALFLSLGILTAFFDFLTYPVICFGVPVLVYMATQRGNTESKYFCIIKTAIAWMTGYVGMWASKWIIASLTTEENIISDATLAVLDRTSNYSSGGEKFILIDVLIDNLYAFIFTPFTIVFIILVIYYIKKIKCQLQADDNLMDLLGPYIAVAMIPFAWYCMATNHSAIHYWFTNKACAVTFLSILIGLNNAYNELLKARGETKHG